IDLKRRIRLNRVSMKWISLLLIQLGCYFSCGTCGKLLVWPTEYSHRINIKTILDELIQRGHELTLTSSASILIDPNTPSAIKFEVYPTSLTKDDLELLFMKWIRKSSKDLPKYTFWTYFSVVQEITGEYSDCIKRLCKDVVFKKKLMMKLQQSRFDLILADAIGPCGELLADLLKILFGYSVEKYSGGLLTPFSYITIVLSELQDRMTFLERKNMIYVVYFDFWFQTFNEKKWDLFYSEVLGRPTTLYETMGKAEIWLIGTYWDLEFPRPVLPHFDFVGGLQCKPTNPLPTEIEEFVQSSGEYGVVVFTLGSMVSHITEEMAHTIASALAQIPQKVLWRFDGKKPDNLGPSTQLYQWIPQNDLLGKVLPKTKAFITRGGTNGIYEAIYHGIPMVGIPLFADQPDNIAHMKPKGAAVSLDMNTMTSRDLLSALKTVI
uniref:glucuronosyltransferase n=1 Tax=Loxodonta africana TaxID=9785 RepID=G3UNI9_LOXAF